MIELYHAQLLFLILSPSYRIAGLFPGLQCDGVTVLA